MTSIFFGMKELLFISIYDGEKYYTDKFSMEEAKDFENNKRSNLLSQGYDVETYEKEYHNLITNFRRESMKTEHFVDRVKLAEKHEIDKINLAKEYLNVEWKS